MKIKEKSELNKNFTKLTQKKGISLIVLIVTIIVIIILAAAVILTVGKNNPVESAREAAFKEDVRIFQDDLALSISKDYTEHAGQRDNKFNADKYTTGGEADSVYTYIPSFNKKYDGKFVIKEDELIYVEEKVSENEKKWLADMTVGAKEKPLAEKVEANVAEYYGKSITNYSANGVTDWKIFHSDGKNVYIIASEYVPVSTLPAKSGYSLTKGSYERTAYFNSNVLGEYSGSSDITDEKIKALNKSYFDYLEEKNTVSENNNMRTVAYMLDTGIWSTFKTKKAEYAIGGPTVEMLMASYSKKYASNGIDYRARAKNTTGYEISNDGGVASWELYYSGMLSTNDSLYVLPSSGSTLESGKTSGANAMWLASPSAGNPNDVMGVGSNGRMNYYYYGHPCIGFRPLVCLKSDIQLEADGDGYKIK